MSGSEGFISVVMQITKTMLLFELLIFALEGYFSKNRPKPHSGVIYPVYTSTFNPERNQFRSHASVYTTPTNPDQRFEPD